MKRAKRAVLLLATSLLLLPTLIACGGAKEVVVEGDKRVAESKIDASKLARAVRARSYYYIYDSSPSLDTAYSYAFTPNYEDYYLLTLLRGYRLKVVGKNDFDLVMGGDSTKGQVLKVKVPTRVAYQFEGFDKAILTLADGTQEVYDSDDYDVNNYDKDSANVAFAYSNNPRSINSKRFREEMDKAVKISFSVRPGMYWSDSTGKRTKYRVVARDFLSFIVSGSLLSYPNKRYQLGGSKELDEYWRKETNSSRYSSKTLDPSTYVYDLYGIDYKSLWDYYLEGKNKPIENLQIDGKTTEVISIHRDPNSSFKEGLRLFLDYDNRSLDGGILFKAYPSEYAKESTAKGSGDDKHGKGLVRELDYYGYGVKREGTLFAGRYIPTSYEVIGGKSTLIYTKNSNFYDQPWVKSKDNIRKIVIVKQKYKSQGDYKTALYTNLVQGDILSISPIFLGEDYSDRIIKGEDPHIKKDQVHWTVSSSGLGKLQAPLIALASFWPEPSVNDKGDLDTSIYHFNDNYAKFMYGADLKTIAAGKAKPFLRFFSDDQISFRSLILAGVNWLQYANYVSKGGGSPMISYLPADMLGSLAGKDSSTSKIQTIYDAYSEANSIFAIVNGKRAIEVPYSGSLEAIKEFKESDSFKGGGKEVYAKLQDAMTALLDRVYAQEGWDSSQRIEVTFIPYYTNPNERVVLAQSNMVNTLNNLDKKGRLAFGYKFISEKSQLVNARITSGGYHSRAFYWSYDWDGNASLLHGLLAYRTNFALPYLTEVLAKRSEGDPNNPFPLLTRIGKLLNKGISEGRYNLKPLKNLLNLTNAQWREASQSDESGYFTPPGAPDLSLTLAKFFFSLQHEFTNQEMIGLNNEIAVLYGWVNNEPLYIAKSPDGGRQTIRQYEYEPATVIADNTFVPIPDEYLILD